MPITSSRWIHIFHSVYFCQFIAASKNVECLRFKRRLLLLIHIQQTNRNTTLFELWEEVTCIKQRSKEKRISLVMAVARGFAEQLKNKVICWWFPKQQTMPGIHKVPDVGKAEYLHLESGNHSSTLSISSSLIAIYHFELTTSLFSQSAVVWLLYFRSDEFAQPLLGTVAPKRIQYHISCYSFSRISANALNTLLSQNCHHTRTLEYDVWRR